MTRHADPALEAALPGRVSGLQLTKYSLLPADFVTPESEQQFADLLRTLGSTADDVTFAAAVDASGELSGSISALRVAGVAADGLLDALLAIEAQRGNPPTLEVLVVGQRQVTRATYQFEAGTVQVYFHAVDDTVITVTSSDEAIAGRFLEALP